MRQITQVALVLILFSNVFLYVHCANALRTKDLGTSPDGKAATECDCGPYGRCRFVEGKKKCQCALSSIEVNGKCFDCDCGPYGICTFVEGEKKCQCALSSIEVNGKCLECDCGKFAKTCSYSKEEKKVCECESNYVEANGKCTKCDCGPNGLCEIESGQKKCVCSPSYVEVNGKCLACECGEATDACVLDSSGQKKCTCRPGYKVNNGTCEECYCGRFGSCTFENGLKKCMCNLYYSARNGTCEHCSCGKNSNSCYFDSNFEKACRCPSRYAERDGSCEECDCGYYGSCSFENGQKKCKCQSFTVEMYGRCVFTTMPPSTTRKPTTTLTSTTEGCDCGENSIACHRDMRGENVCDCHCGYLQNNGQCEECNCGPHGGCTFVSGQKECFCKPYASELNGVCVDFRTTSEGTTDSINTSTNVFSTPDECDCGPRGKCVFEYGEKKCDCDAFTIEKDGRCVDCYCGENSRECRFNKKGDKVCKCKSGYSQVSGFCFECNCGPNARSCFYEKDETKICSCDAGYTQINGRCLAICRADNCVHGKCEIVGNNFKCRCHEGFIGDRCEERISNKESKQELLMILILVVAISIFILLSVMLCCWTRLLSKVHKK